jgi:hypothetical protein
MALDVNRLLDQLEDARESTLALIDKFQKIADTAQLFEGVIKESVPLNIKKDIEIITDLSEGQAQNSLSSLLQLILNVPVSSIREPRAIRTTLNTSAATQAAPVTSAAPATEPIDVTPDVSAGAQSAVAAQQESTKPESALSAYLKAGRIKEQQAKYIANTINLGKTLEGIQNDSPYGKSMNEMVSPDLHFDLEKIVEGNPNANEIGAHFDNSLNSAMRRVAANKENYQRMHEGEAPVEVPDWKKAAQTVHMNESRNGFEGLFGGVKHAQVDRQNCVENISFEDMFAGGIADGKGSVHVVENAWNTDQKIG